MAKKKTDQKFPRHTVTLVRIMRREVPFETLEKQTEYLLGRALSAVRGKGWIVKRRKLKLRRSKVKTTVGREFIFQKNEGRRDAEKGQWAQILAKLVSAGGASRFGVSPWTVQDRAGKRLVASATPRAKPKRKLLRPRQPCPKCGKGILVDPDYSRYPTPPPTGKDYEWCEYTVDKLVCNACKHTFKTRLRSNIDLSSGTASYVRE